MKSFICVIASIVVAGVCAYPGPHHGNNSSLTKEHMDHLHHDKNHPHPHNLAEDKPVSALASHNADFAFALYKQLSSQEDAKNIFFSPLSISSALSMLALGAKGVTHQELFMTLGYNDIPPTDVNDAYEHMFHSLGHTKGTLQLDTGNAMVLQEKFKLKDTFVKDAKHYFDAEGFTVDFNMPDEAAKHINEYIAKRTQDKVTDMASDLDKNTVMMLINYIYFRGKWQKPFEAKFTNKADFHVDETTKVSVDMMKRTGRYDYYHDDTNKTAVLMIPYQGNASLMVVLPDEGQMKKVESLMNKDYIKHWHDSLSRSNIDVRIPKFSASVSYTLTDTLKEMGLVSAFHDEADFSGISEEAGLKISKVAHKAVLNVDEKGTEAAGVTTAEVMPMSYPRVMELNRPFFIFILEESTQSILFMGKITDPTAQ